MMKVLVVAMAFSGLLFAEGTSVTTTGSATHKVAKSKKAKKAKGKTAPAPVKDAGTPAPTQGQ